MLLKAIFNRLPGTWTLARTLQSDSPVATPSGTVQGVATIVHYYRAELHYQERGWWHTVAGSSYEIQRDYRYCYDVKTAQLVKYALSPQGELHYLYPLVILTVPCPSGNLIATGQLLCQQDHYQATYLFREGVDFNQFSVDYVVSGPKKSYRSSTVFERT